MRALPASARHMACHTQLAGPLPACRVCAVVEEFVRLLHHCGMGLGEVDICAGRGDVINKILAQGEPQRGWHLGRHVASSWRLVFVFVCGVRLCDAGRLPLSLQPRRRRQPPAAPSAGLRGGRRGRRGSIQSHAHLPPPCPPCRQPAPAPFSSRAASAWRRSWRSSSTARWAHALHDKCTA